ncbi:MAG: winged helix-turn-helix transcriptional regulator [Clostridia bacterium]|nr:winged helix-turn-helix transcriptional regulator [Clostridia bacterium]
MDKEYEILQYISMDKNVTQRKIAEKAGLSLGAANILIKRLIKKGLIKIEHVNSRAVRYMLTPTGFIQKTQRACEFIAYSYNYITGLNSKIKGMLNENTRLERVYLLGVHNELYDIVSNAVREVGIALYSVSSAQLDSFDKNVEYIVLCWDYENELLLTEKGIKYVNLFNL